MSKQNRLIEKFGTESPTVHNLRTWIGQLRTSDCFWKGYPSHEIRRTNYDILVAQRALTELGYSGV